MLQNIALQSRRAMLWTVALVTALSAVVPLLVVQNAGAAPALQQRKLETTSAVPGATGVSLKWTFDTFDLGSATNIQQINVQFCDTPLGTCNNTMTPTLPTPTPSVTLGGPWTGSGATASTAGNTITVTMGTPGDENNKTGLELGIAGFTNFGTANKSYYTRVTVFSDAGTTLEWEGVFAQSTSQTLTVNARVQERLDFCVGSTSVNDATTTPGASCSAITGTTVNLGNVENGKTNVTPVATINGGDATPTNGIAMVRTNAFNGVAVAYRALQNNGHGMLKVAGASCHATNFLTDLVDQCFNTNPTAAQFAGTAERFGMTVAGVNCSNTNAYSCAFASGNYNLQRLTNYDGNGGNTFVSDGNGTDNGQVSGNTNGLYAWQENGNVTSIASSTSSTTKVVDNEALILKFAAAAGITTPTGAYTVSADFIATATF